MKLWQGMVLACSVAIWSGCGGATTGGDMESPIFTSAASVSVAENQTTAITLAATDTNAVTYGISGGDSAAFDIDSGSGVVTFKMAPNYEEQTSYSFTATATDSEGNSATQDVTITITDVVEPFTMVWETNSTDLNITIPTDSNYDYNYTIDWGDGEIEEGISGDATHIYGSEGNWTVKISGEFPHMKMISTFPIPQKDLDNAHQLFKVTAWGDIKWKSMAYMLAGCDRFDIEANDRPILKDVEKMWGMFYFAKSMNAPIGDWDVSNVKSMFEMFLEANNFNQPIGDWNVSKVVDMDFMFYHATSFDQDISKWDVSHVYDMMSMFNGTPFNQDISDWNVSSVVDISGMFANTTSFNQDISSWDVSGASDMGYMFLNATSFKDHDLSGWDVANVTNHNDFATGSGGNIIEPIWP